MNQKGNNFKSEKSVDRKKSHSSQNNNVIVKQMLMDKYGLSSQGAEKLLSKILKKDNGNDNKFNSKISTIPKHSSDSKIDEKINNNYNKNQQKSISKNSKFMKIDVDNYSVNQNISDNFRIGDDISNHETSSKKRDYQKMNPVDSIIENILPNYDQQVSICVNHVDLSFEVQNEKVDTIKECFIRTLKRNKSKKIKIHALKDVSFKIYKGEKVGIIGYNGAGKSTLLNVITGIYSPDKGQVVTHGNISPLLSLGAGFDLNFSGRRNIILNGAVLGYDKEFLESKIDEIIEFSELGDFIDIPIKNYSSGMLAKLGFSIATSVNPDILIIDEILGVGDATFAKKSADKIKSLMDGGTTVLLVSHSIPQIRKLCDKAIWMDNGCLRAMGDVNRICDEYLKDSEKASKEQLKNIKFN